MTRDERVLLFAMLTIAVERSVSVQFWRAFNSGGGLPDPGGRNETRVLRVQEGMKGELRRLADELWPEEGT